MGRQRRNRSILHDFDALPQGREQFWMLGTDSLGRDFLALPGQGQPAFEEDLKRRRGGRG
jgi:hypothetical protein